MPDQRLDLPFHRLHLLGRTGAGWAILGTAVLGALVFVGGQLVVLPVVLVAEGLGADVSADPITPAGLAWINLAWAVAIPFAIFVGIQVHRMSSGWLVSVAGRIRWGWLATCIGLAAIALAITVALSASLPHQGGTAIGSDLNDFTDRTAAYVLVILLLTPLQAAGEEFVFRGYLTQGFGGLLPGRAGVAVAVVVPALLFALAHGAQDPPVFVDRFVFGLLAGAVVILTGGLEAAIAMHVLNNWVAFGLALGFGDMNAALHPSSSTWWTLPGTLVQAGTFLALTVWVARRRGVASRTAAVLERPERDV